MIPFAKLQGAGNGYVVIDGRERQLDWARVARLICDPHFGVGSDGLAVVMGSLLAPVRMRIFNSDGSESEMSGNGIRLFAKFVLERGIADASERGLAVETGGGVRIVAPQWRDGRVVAARVAMGAPCFDPARIPLDPGLLAAAAGAGSASREVPLEVGGLRLALTCLAIGNPHAVAILEESIDDFPLAEIGPLVMHHPLFPNRVNFEIVNVRARGLIRARIFERGEGETLASGTGSTAAVIAARLHGLVDDEVRVRLRGGELRVGWSGEGEAWLEGPAVEVFTGVWPEEA